MPEYSNCSLSWKWVAGIGFLATWRNRLLASKVNYFRPSHTGSLRSTSWYEPRPDL